MHNSKIVNTSKIYISIWIIIVFDNYLNKNFDVNKNLFINIKYNKKYQNLYL